MTRGCSFTLSSDRFRPCPMPPALAAAPGMVPFLLRALRLAFAFAESPTTGPVAVLRECSRPAPEGDDFVRSERPGQTVSLL